MKLTKRSIDAAKHPANGARFLRDDALRGFGVRITPGSKSFFIEKEVHGIGRRLTLGRFGEITLEQARKLAQEKFVEIAKGNDPIADRRAQRTAARFADLEQLYLARHAPRKKSAKDDIGMLTHHLSFLRPRTLASITRAEIIALHTKLGTMPSTVVRPGRPTPQPAPRLANKVLAFLRLLFNLATDWGLHHGPNPTTRIKPFPQKSRDRFVTPQELPRLWKALAAEESPFVRAAFLVSLLTGARRDEVLTMKWTDVDLKAGAWRIPETKAGRVHVLPLPRAVLAELAKLPRFEGNGYVFVGRHGRGHLVNLSLPWTRITHAAGLSDVRIHDLRRTLGSWLVAQGASLPLVGKALNHRSVSTTQIYARMQLEPVRLALEQNATAMLAVVEEGQS